MTQTIVLRSVLIFKTGRDTACNCANPIPVLQPIALQRPELVPRNCRAVAQPDRVVQLVQCQVLGGQRRVRTNGFFNVAGRKPAIERRPRRWRVKLLFCAEVSGVQFDAPGGTADEFGGFRLQIVIGQP